MIRNALAASLLALTAASPATILDFEHLPGGTLSSNGQYVTYDGPLDVAGYRLTGSPTTFTSWTPSAIFYDNYTGSTALTPFTSSATSPAPSRRSVRLGRPDGRTFDVLSADVAPYFIFGFPGPLVKFAGTLATGGTVSASYVFPDRSLHTVSLPGFTRLTSFSIYTDTTFGAQYAPEFQFDNLNLVANPVPEPAPAAALGVGALSLLRRRRRP